MLPEFFATIGVGDHPEGDQGGADERAQDTVGADSPDGASTNEEAKPAVITADAAEDADSDVAVDKQGDNAEMVREGSVDAVWRARVPTACAGPKGPRVLLTLDPCGKVWCAAPRAAAE